MTPWTEFFFLCGSAAASLTGLMFLAITFGSRLITEEKLAYVEAFFSPISYHFIQAFVLCAVALIPSAGPKTLALVVLVSTAGRLVQLVPMIRLTRAASRESGDVEASDWVLGVVLPAVVYAALLATGIAYLAGSRFAPELLAASLLALIVIALFRAWEMLLWIATKVD